MNAHKHSIRLVGELVVAAFDEAAHHSSDPKEVARMATLVIEHVLLTARRLPPRPPRAQAIVPVH